MIFSIFTMEVKHSEFILMFLFAFPAFTNAKYHNITIHNLTHVTNDSFFYPTVLKLSNQLLYVSYPKVNADYRIKLESTAITDTCEITISVPRHHELLSPRAIILGNKKLIIAFVETGEDYLQPYITFHVLDPLKSCALYGNFSVMFDDAILWSYQAFDLIAYQDTFDVFAKSFLHCRSNGSLCLIRFDDQGNNLGTLNFDFPTDNSNIDLIEIHPLQEFSFSDDYLVVSKHTSNLTIVDHNLKVLRSLPLNGFITAHSVLNGDISVCYYVDDDEPHSQCLKVDSRLKTVANISLSNSHYFVSKRLYNLADGSSLFISLSRNKIRTLVRRLSVDGKISSPEMYLYQCETFVTDPQDKFIELKGGEYCFSFVCKNNMITHCINSAEAKKLLSYSD